MAIKNQGFLEYTEKVVTDILESVSVKIKDA